MLSSCASNSTKEKESSKEITQTEKISTPLLTPSPESDKLSPIKELEVSDFEIMFQNTHIFIGLQTKELVDKLGDGTADESNNYGFVGNDPDYKYKYYMRGYPKEEPVIEVYTREEIVSGDSEVSQINLLNYQTNRGSKVGDKVDSVKQSYGESKFEDNHVSYVLSNKAISFYSDDNGFIETIMISETSD
jgi:hypothetical protein